MMPLSVVDNYQKLLPNTHCGEQESIFRLYLLPGAALYLAPTGEYHTKSPMTHPTLQVYLIFCYFR